MTSTVPSGSSDFSERQLKVTLHLAEPEVCTHLHFYRGQQPLAQWFDAFADPLLVSTAISREQVERFAAAVGGSLSLNVLP